MDEIRLGDMEAAREDRLTPASPAAGGGIAKPVGLSDLDLEQDLQRLPDTDRTEGFALPSQSKLFDLGQSMSNGSRN